MSSSRDESLPAGAAGAGALDAVPPHDGCVLLVDIEPALAALLCEWLGQAGVRALQVSGEAASALRGRVDLMVVEIPFPRQGASPRVQGLAQAQPGTPILALSPTFFAGVTPRGDVARQLGVAAVLATPVSRDAWLGAVRKLLERQR